MPEPSDERALFRAVLGRTNDCPGIEELASPDQTAAVRKHLDGCARCRAELALLHEFETAEPAVEEAAQVQWIKSELRRRSQEIVSAREPAAPSPWWGEWIGR